MWPGWCGSHHLSSYGNLFTSTSFISPVVGLGAYPAAPNFLPVGFLIVAPTCAVWKLETEAWRRLRAADGRQADLVAGWAARGSALSMSLVGPLVGWWNRRRRRQLYRWRGEQHAWEPHVVTKVSFFLSICLCTLFDVSYIIFSAISWIKQELLSTKQAWQFWQMERIQHLVRWLSLHRLPCHLENVICYLE
jgi:hypothetical protein